MKTLSITKEKTLAEITGEHEGKDCQKLGGINFISDTYPSDKKDRTVFKKQFKAFKKMNKHLMKKLKAGEIDNLSYIEEETKDGEIKGSWIIEPVPDNITKLVDAEDKPEAPEPIDDLPGCFDPPEETEDDIPPRLRAECNDDCANCKIKDCENSTNESTKDIITMGKPEALPITKEEAKELFAKVKTSKPYKSVDYAGKLIDILLNDKAEAVDKLAEDNRDYPASYKQTRALYRIIFGKHYDHNTYDALMEKLN